MSSIFLPQSNFQNPHTIFSAPLSYQAVLLLFSSSLLLSESSILIPASGSLQLLVPLSGLIFPLDKCPAYLSLFWPSNIKQPTLLSTSCAYSILSLCPQHFLLSGHLFIVHSPTISVQFYESRVCILFLMLFQGSENGISIW